MDLEELIVRIVNDNPTGLSLAEIVREVQKAGYIGPNRPNLSREMSAIVKELVSRQEVKMVETDNLHEPRRYFPVPAA